MALHITPRPDQLAGLALLRDLDAQDTERLISSLTNHGKALIMPSELRQLLSQVFPDKPSEVIAISRQLISLYTLCRQRNLNPEELLEGLTSGLQSSASGWSKKEITQWRQSLPLLKELLSLSNIKTIVKALDLSYDYANLFQNAKILTDIRPVFDDNASTIEGAAISFTLRLFYDNIDESKNISIALDEKDVTTLMNTCSRALKKAKSAKKFMIDANISKTFICGENNDL